MALIIIMIIRIIIIYNKIENKIIVFISLLFIVLYYAFLCLLSLTLGHNGLSYGSN
jgi:hypothetical protein